MIEKVTLQLSGDADFTSEGGPRCEEMNPKTLLLYAFKSFHVVYNIECDTEDDQAKVSRAVTLAHEKYCGMMQMLRKVAPVSHEIAVVSTEPAKA